MSVFRVFLVLILPHSDWIRRDMKHLSVFSPNARKCVPEKLRLRTLFKQQLRNLDHQDWWFNQDIMWSYPCISLGVNMWCFVQLTTPLGVTLLHRSFSRFLKCTNGTKSHKASHMYFIQLNKEIYIWSPWTAALPRWFDVLKRCLELQITKTLYKSVKKFAATSRLRK